jgi:hypothetical protein
MKIMKTLANLKIAFRDIIKNDDKPILLSQTGLVDCFVLRPGHILLNGFVTNDRPMTRRDRLFFTIKAFRDALIYNPL